MMDFIWFSVDYFADYLLIFALFFVGYSLVMLFFFQDKKPIKSRLLAVLFGLLCVVIIYPPLDHLAVYLEAQIEKERKLRVVDKDSLRKVNDSLRKENKRLRENIELLD